jgi:lipoate---protein ligase
MSKPILRVIETDFNDSRMHISYGQAMVDQHQQGLQPDTLRFMRFNPSVLIGRHQVLNDEVNIDYCQKNNIQIVRRITGGGAIYIDSGQLGWELAISKKNIGSGQLSEITKILCEAAAKGLGKLNIDAKFRPRNDLEVDGRKIAGTGGFFDGDTLFFQAGALVDMDVNHMTSSLNIPAAKLNKRNIKSGSDRVVTVRELLGDKTPSIQVFSDNLCDALCEALGLEPQRAECSQAELELAQEYYDDEIGQDDYVYEINRIHQGDVVRRGHTVTPGGIIYASVKLKGAKLNMIGEIVFNGDLFVSPPRVLYDLEAHLKGVYLPDVAAAIGSFFEKTKINMMSVQPEHFVNAINNALEQGQA